MSSVPAAKAALVSALQANPDLSDVQVTYGPPFPSPQREFICVTAADGEQEWAAMGFGSETRKEEFDLTVLISVLREGQDAQAADQRCFALFSEVEAQIRFDPTLGNTVKEAKISRFHLEMGISRDEMNRSSDLTVQVNCMAFI